MTHSLHVRSSNNSLGPKGLNIIVLRHSIPAKNGLAEWLVQSKTSPCAAGPKDNQKRLDRFLLSYLSSPHSTTKETPFVLFMGRCLRSALDLPKPDIAASVADSQSAHMSSREKKRSLGILLLDSRCLFVIINLVVRRG